jgi:hypothetical protein
MYSALRGCLEGDFRVVSVDIVFLDIAFGDGLDESFAGLAILYE